jgi:hypothetical protein
MAKATIAAPNYAAYQSDPIQQIYARGTLDRDMSGLSAMFLDAADRNKKRGIDSYESGVREANALSGKLAQQEMEQEKLLTILKASAGLMEKGYAPSGMQAAGQIFNDPAANDQFSQATIGKLLADAAASNAKGAEGGDKFEYNVDTSPSGVTTGTWKGKGANPDRLQAAIQQRVEAEMRARGLQPSGKGPLAMPASKTDVQRAEDAKSKYSR